MFEIDLGASGSDINTFLQWSARGTQDGAVRAKQFYTRDGAAKDEFEAAQSDGFVIDLDSLRQAGRSQTAWSAWLQNGSGTRQSIK